MALGFDCGERHIMERKRESVKMTMKYKQQFGERECKWMCIA